MSMQVCMCTCAYGSVCVALGTYTCECMYSVYVFIRMCTCIYVLYNMCVMSQV